MHPGQTTATTCCRESCNVAHLGDIEKTEADRYPMVFYGFSMFWSTNFFVGHHRTSDPVSVWNLCEICVKWSPGLSWCAKGRLSNLWRVLPRSLQCMSRRRNEGSAILDHQRRDTKRPGSVLWFHWSHDQHFQTRVWYLFDICLIGLFHIVDACWCICFCTHPVPTPWFPWSKAQRLSTPIRSLGAQTFPHLPCPAPGHTTIPQWSWSPQSDPPRTIAIE